MPNPKKYLNVDLTGQTHGRLTVIRKANHGRTQWVCRCECGNIKTMCASDFFRYQSCGCLEKENKRNLGRHSITHGMTETILYKKYCGMKERCHNPNYLYYHRYGGRGIKVCKEWKESFEAFAKWAYENGYDDSKTGYEQTLDRIDNDKDYCPENCRWATQKEQVKNRSNSTHIIYNGEDLNCTEFARKYNIDSEAFVRRRHRKGQSPEQIITDWNALQSGNYITLDEAAEKYRVCKATIYKRIYDGKLNAKKVGMKWLIAC